MPEDIIRRFQQQYGPRRGKAMYYKTAHAQGRDPGTFRKLAGPVAIRRALKP